MTKDGLDITAECTEIYLNFDLQKPEESMNYLASKFAELFNASSVRIFRDDSANSHVLIAEKSKPLDEKNLGSEHTQEKIDIPVLGSNVRYSVELDDGRKLKEMQLVVATIVNIFIKKLLKDFELSMRSRFDDMTMTYNRNEFEEIKRKIKEQKNEDYIIVSFVDIFSLKTVNDTYGHEHGDDYIVKVAKSLRDYVGNTFNNNMSLFRSGGDEFVIICKAADQVTADTTMQLLEAKLEEAKRFIEGESYSIVGLPNVTSFDYGISCGLSSDLSNTLDKADKTMLANKGKHKEEKKKAIQS